MKKTCSSETAKYLSDIVSVAEAYDRPVKHLRLDSRQVQAGDVFLACRGERRHGRDFIPAVIAAGAAAVLLEDTQSGGGFLENGIPYVQIPCLAERAVQLAAAFYGHPGADMQLIGVTGTNGKTSVSHFIAALSASPTGLLGTLGYGVYGALAQGRHTTPDPVSLQAVLAELKQQGVRRAVMEVSSHALAQERVAGLRFDTAVFTNLSRDHLDYHLSMENYGAAKQKLFQEYTARRAVINRDDDFGKTLLRELPAEVQGLTYGLEARADIFPRRMEVHEQGLSLEVRTPWGEGTIHSGLYGSFNAANLLAALAVLLDLGMPLAAALEGLGGTKAPPGRMEKFSVPGRAVVVVDYAHTPDALAQALQALRPHCRGRLWCVFGCGGERDRGKRPLMGAAAARYADDVVLTNDNPRHEDPAAIIQEISSGMPSNRAKQIIQDRAEAIRYTLQYAAAQDMVLLAGKGHETYQQIGDEYFDFSDRDFVRQV